jgi:5'-3' exonuclease
LSTFLIVDVNNMAHRVFHGTQGTIDIKMGMALQITLNSIKASWKKFKADHVVFCMEGHSWRHSIYPGYKAQRKVQQAAMTPREKEEQELFFGTYDIFLEFLTKHTNVSMLKCKGAEADDMIARWIQLHPNDQHIVISSDKDFYQLLAPNVKLYDGMKGWTIGIDGIFDDKNKPATVKRNIKVKDPISGKKLTKTEAITLEAPDPEYELFLKIIRGDSSDNVMSAYPGVREKGTLKKPGIIDAFNDRHNKGFNWNNFMLQEWEKLVGTDAFGKPIIKKVRVLDEYNINKIVIDLTQQPLDVLENIDNAIVLETGKPTKPMVGISFMRFANEMGLITISKNPNEYATFLQAPYAKIN